MNIGSPRTSSKRGCIRDPYRNRRVRLYGYLYESKASFAVLFRPSVYSYLALCLQFSPSSVQPCAWCVTRMEFSSARSQRLIKIAKSSCLWTWWQWQQESTTSPRLATPLWDRATPAQHKASKWTFHLPKDVEKHPFTCEISYNLWDTGLQNM